MAELVPIPFSTLLRRAWLELERTGAIFDLPARRFHHPAPDLDTSVTHCGHLADNPLGPAAGPHTQLAQNVALAWLAGARIIELKTVQVNDRLSLSRPCIDMATVGYNTEWSQELRLEQSLAEYVKASMLVEILDAAGVTDASGAHMESAEDAESAEDRHNPQRPPAEARRLKSEACQAFGVRPRPSGRRCFPRAPVRAPVSHTVFDISVGYDLAGIRSAAIGRWLDGMKDASPLVDELRRHIPPELAAYRDLAFRTEIGDSITLSTFHGTPAGEIEAICEYLIAERGFHVVIKLNPPMLGRERVEHLLRDVLGYTGIDVNPAAYGKGLAVADAVQMVRRLQAVAARHRKTVGVKCGNTLEVRNKGGFLKEAVQYLSGQPLHVLHLALVAEWRKALGPELPISFSAGVDAANVADCVAAGLSPVTVCTDLLRPGGYARLWRYLVNLSDRMRAAGATSIPEFIAAWGTSDTSADRSALARRPDATVPSAIRAAILANTETLLGRALADPRYRASHNRQPPRKIGSRLWLFDCINCDKCIPVCPNDANFAFVVTPAETRFRMLEIAGGQWREIDGPSYRITKPQQIATFADACNDCGNCDVFCPEDGGPYIEKPRFFRSVESWRRGGSNAFVLTREHGRPVLLGRFGSETFRLSLDRAASRSVFETERASVVLDRATHEVVAAETRPGTDRTTVDMAYFVAMATLLEGMLDPRRVSFANVGFVADGFSQNRSPAVRQEPAEAEARETRGPRPKSRDPRAKSRVTHIEFILNSQPFRAPVVPGMSLMDVLREQAGLISPKNGCAPQGSCGACTVIVDGRVLPSCAVPAERAAGRHVVTLEGFTARERDVFARAFTVAGAVQCGFCIPGIVVGAKHLIDRNPRPSREEIARALNNHVCRCTGYVKIIDAIELAARALGGEPLPEPDWSGAIGSSLPRMDSERFVLGERPYIDDLQAPGMLTAAFLFSPKPRIRLVRLDTSRAEHHPGVARVVTARDVPGDRHQGLIEKDWPLFIAEGEVTHCIGDILAAAVAEDLRTAREAVGLIRLEYEELAGVFSPEEALAPGAPRLHAGRENLLSRSVVRRGDVDQALARSAFVETRTFRTQMIEHAFLEPESALAVPNAGAIAVYTQGQGVFDDRHQIASFLGWPEDCVHVTLVSNGGAFGGKEDLSIQGQVALMAVLTGRPVKATLTREESIRLHPKRHPMTITLTVGCDREGHLTALRSRIVGDTGAYASVGGKVLERAAGHSGGPYRIPACDIEALAVYTNNLPCGAMRGFGANQAAFAIEGMLDILAERVGLDGWEMRWRNVVDIGDAFCTGQIFDKSVGIRETLLAVKDAYYGARYAGIACGIKNVGIGNGMPEYGHAHVTVNPDETITIRTGFTEMGQGFCTAMIQCFSGATGIDPRKVRVVVDTSRPTPCGMTTASRATVLGGRAVVEAAATLKADLDRSGTLGALAGREYFGEVVVDYTTALEDKTDRPITHMTYGFATQVCILDDDGRLKEFVAAHDVGHVINRTMLEGQIEGSIHMGLGYALTEALELDHGVPTSFALRSLGLLRAKDMPRVRVILVEAHEPEGPFGAKGVGEIGLVPTAPAVAAALHTFDGVRRYSLPMRDSPAARAIRRFRD